MRLRTWTTVLVLLASPALVRGTTIRSFDANKHHRFNNSSQFIGAGLDFSGLGNTSVNGDGQWAVMISPTHFLSANHFHPATNATLNFYGGNVKANVVTRKAASGQRIGNTDLWLGRLDNAIDAGSQINFLPILISPDAQLLGRELFVYGKGNRVGRNTIDRFDDITSSVGDNRMVTYDYDAPTGGVGGDEARVESGDSGSGGLVVFNGRLALLSLHSLMYTDNSGANVFFPGLAATGSVDTQVAPYVRQIDAILRSRGERLTLVPEPGATALMAIGLGGAWAAWRRRGRRSA